MLDQARAAGQQLPLLEVHADVLEACVRAGEGDRDNSIVIAEIRRRLQTLVGNDLAPIVGALRLYDAGESHMI